MNPFETLEKQITELRGLVVQILEKPKEDLSQKKYTVKAAAELFAVDPQTVRSRIKKGKLNAEKFGNRVLISHSSLYDELNTIKSVKYKR